MPEAENAGGGPAGKEGPQGLGIMELTVDGFTVIRVPTFTGRMVAPMIVEPPETPVASPPLFTVAIAGLLDVHVKVTPGT